MPAAGSPAGNQGLEQDTRLHAAARSVACASSVLLHCISMFTHISDVLPTCCRRETVLIWLFCSSMALATTIFGLLLLRHRGCCLCKGCLLARFP